MMNWLPDTTKVLQMLSQATLLTLGRKKRHHLLLKRLPLTIIISMLPGDRTAYMLSSSMTLRRDSAYSVHALWRWFGPRKTLFILRYPLRSLNINSLMVLVLPLLSPLNSWLPARRTWRRSTRNSHTSRISSGQWIRQTIQHQTSKLTAWLS